MTNGKTTQWVKHQVKFMIINAWQCISRQNIHPVARRVFCCQKEDSVNLCPHSWGHSLDHSFWSCSIISLLSNFTPSTPMLSHSIFALSAASRETSLREPIRFLLICILRLNTSYSSRTIAPHISSIALFSCM